MKLGEISSGRSLTIGLVGNPNCGKSTLFNALTGARQRVGNWPGVTVEKKTGSFSHKDRRVEVVDLPGTYSLDVVGDVSLDEQVARRFVLSREADLIVNIVDASNLERNLYLTAQLIEMRVPLVLALNMSDVAAAKGVKIDAKALAAELGCPVIELVASKNEGVDRLKDYLADTGSFEAPRATIGYPAPVEAVAKQIQEKLAASYSGSADLRWLAIKALEGDDEAVRQLAPLCGQAALDDLRTETENVLGDEVDIAAADARYGFIGKVARASVTQPKLVSRTFSDRVDRIVLNRMLGIPIFLAMMYLMFMFTINLGGAFIDFFDGVAGVIFVDGFGHLLEAAGAPTWLTVLLAKGAGGGIQVVASFIPIIGFLFFFLSILEDSGYMARAAFVMDRAMRFVGLPGKSFVPLIVGFGCNVPAVMASRTLEGERDRLMTMAMVPFMSCGARLPVYALFAVAFFPASGQNMVFLLYLIGIAAAVLTGLVLKRTLLPGQSTPFVMELPPYHLPTLRGVLTHCWSRLSAFIWKAGKIIVPMVLVLNMLNAAGTDGSFGHEDSKESVLSAIGKAITPVFAPIGLTQDNWPAAVGIFTGVLAKEAVVGTLDALYAQEAANANAANAIEGEADEAEAAGFDFWAGIREAAASVPENLSGIVGMATDPLQLDIGDTADREAAAESQAVHVDTFGAMSALFGSAAAAFAYQVLVLLYFPCVAVLGAINRETGLRWTGFIALWGVSLGYGLSVLVYQGLTFAAHPASSFSWMVGVLAVWAAGLFVLARRGRRDRQPLMPLAESVA